MDRRGAVVRALVAAALLAGCTGAGASPSPGRSRSGDDVQIGTALSCDRTTCEERTADGRLVSSYPNPAGASGR